MQCYSSNEVSLLLMCPVFVFARMFLKILFYFYMWGCCIRTNCNVSGGLECGKLC